MKNIQSTLLNELGGFFELNGIYVPFKDPRKKRDLRTEDLEVFGNSFYSEIFDGDMRNHNRFIKGEFVQSGNKEYIKFLKTNNHSNNFDLAYILEKDKRTPEFTGVEGFYQGRWGKLKEPYNLEDVSKDFFDRLSYNDLAGQRHAELKVFRKD